MRWRKISLIGVGLLGGSLGLAIKRRALADRVSAYVRRAESVVECRAAGVADEVSTDLESIVTGADLVILCTPLAQMESLGRQMIPFLASGALVTDVGSVKAPIVHAMESVLASSQARFIGSHPMAGAEKMGVKAAREDLFRNAICIVTQTAATRPPDVDLLIEFWKTLGARPLLMNPEIHDQLACRASHLPHLLAAGLAQYVLNPEFGPEQGQICATGFRDTTRVASGSPEMWRDIALSNKVNLIAELDGAMAVLKAFRDALGQEDVAAVEHFYQTAKFRRDQWCLKNAAPPPE
jgi:prephenate dehydrogenase